MCILFCWLLLSLSSGEIAAQSVSVRGSVVAANDEAIPFANLFVRGSEVGASADAEGYFELHGLFAGDTLTASAIGFEEMTLVLGFQPKQNLRFILPEATVVLQTVVVQSDNFGKDIETGKPLIQQVIAAKKQNDYREIPNYSCEVYNKMELDLIGEKILDKPVLRKIEALESYTDSLSDEQLLPALLSESLSDYVYRSKPSGSKEFIKATRISGMEAEQFAPFLGQLHQEFSIYDNWMGMLGQNFVSPISNAAANYYKFYLADSSFDAKGSKIYLLQFTPRHHNENMFYGTLEICAETMAVSSLDMQLASGGDINFVSHVAVRQEYKQQDGRWVRDREQLVIRFHGLGKKSGLIGRKTTSYRDYKLNQSFQKGLFGEGERSTMYDDASEKDDGFWRAARHEALNDREEAANTLSDRLEEDPTFNTWVDIVQFLFTGYQEAGPIEFGPYFKMIGRNPVEGWRLRLGMRTNDRFSSKIRLSGYAAYGLLDQQWKMGGGLTWLPDRHNWQEVGLWVQDDILTGSLLDDQLSEDNLLTGLYRRSGAPAQKLMRQRYGRLWYRRDWTTGLSSHFELRRQELTPFFPAHYYIDSSDPARIDSVVIRNEFSISTRFAPGEKFLERNFSRISLGSNGPVWQFRYAYGLRGLSRRSFTYHRIEAGLAHKFPIHPLGQTEFDLRAGKIFGELPLLLLESHQGNETWFYSDNAFSLMNQYEFTSDAWATVFVTHHFDGFILNRIPLMEKLKWRSLVSVKAAYGFLSYDNQQMNALLDGKRPYHVLGANTNPLPYVEAGVGIENIFRLLRVDAIWRLTYLDHPSVQPFGVRLGMEFQF